MSETTPVADDALRVSIATAIMQAHLPTNPGEPPRKWSIFSHEAQSVFLRGADAAYAVMRREFDATTELLVTAAEARGAQRERERTSAAIGLAVKEWREIAWQRELDAAPDVSEVAVSLDDCAATIERIVEKYGASAVLATTCKTFPKSVSGTPDALAVQP